MTTLAVPPRHELTPWRRGRLDGRARGAQLVFGRMFEDAALELELFPPGGRVFCIASAGCTALALAARGDRVTAVDLNPAQTAYARSLAAGGPARAGAADRFMARARRLLRFLGISPVALRAFLEMDDPALQAARWRELFDRPAVRLAADAAFSRAALRRAYDPALVNAVPPRFGRVLLARLARTTARHPNRTNPYLWRLLLGIDPPGCGAIPSAPFGLPDFVIADAAAHLERCPTSSFDALSLSNILDGADPAYARRLWTAVRRAAAPGALSILRSFAEPADPTEAEDAARDRAGLWGAVRVARRD